MEEKIFLENLERKKKAIGLIHRIYLTQIKNARIHTASTKTKSEIRGGGRKPWKQKGTGNARAGSSRSPLWVGGGVIFGPKPRLVYKKINKKERRLGILSAFYLKKNQHTLIEENLFNEFREQKTKKVLNMIQQLGLNLNKKILFVLPQPNKSLWLATRNLENVEVTTVNSLNVKQLLTNHHIILSKSSIDVIHAIYGKQYA
jgi:large subunit ribosomal protein L4